MCNMNIYSSEKYINKIDFNIYFLKMDVKQMYLAAYYELGYFEEARSMIETFGKYISQNTEVANKYKEGYQNYRWVKLNTKITFLLLPS